MIINIKDIAITEDKSGKFNINLSCYNITKFNDVLVYANLKSTYDITILMVIINEIKLCMPRRITVFIPLLPYSGQSKSFRSVFAAIINNAEVDIICIRSEYNYEKIINNLITIEQHELISYSLENNSNVIMLYGESHQYTHNNKGHMIKKRLFSNEEAFIKDSIRTYDNDHCAILIHDSINDNVLLSIIKQLKHDGAGLIDLYVTHGKFSNGIAELYKAGLNNIITLDHNLKLNVDICDQYILDGKLTIINTEDLAKTFINV